MPSTHPRSPRRIKPTPSPATCPDCGHVLKPYATAQEWATHAPKFTWRCGWVTCPAGDSLRSFFAPYRASRSGRSHA
jgi:hypothetical protein